MRVLFAVSAWSGLYRSTVPLGWALQAAGHQVRFVCHASEVDTLAGAGVTPVALTDGWTMSFAGRLRNYLDAVGGTWPFTELPPHPITGEPMRDLREFDFHAFMSGERPRLEKVLADSADAVVEFARSWRPDLVVHDLLSLEGLLTAKVLGVPALAHPWGPLGTDERDAEAAMMPADFSGAFARYGIGAMSFDHVDYFIDPNPPALAPPTRAMRLPVRYIPYNGPGVTPDWVLDEPAKPRVCVVWGNSVTTMFGPGSWVVPDVLAALATLDCEIVVTLNRADFAAMRGQLGDLAELVRLVENVPVHLFWESCAVVVHHGGGNAVLNGAIAGVPQLAITNGHDQHLIGQRLADSGAGLRILGHEANRDNLRAAAARLLGESSFREQAQKLRTEMRAAPSPTQLVATLEEIAGRSAGPRGDADR